MKIFGKCCERIDSDQDKLNFKKMYSLDPYQFIFDHELFNITRIFPNKFRYIAFLEYDASPRQVFVLDDDEHLMVYNDIKGEIFNTDQIAFFSLIKNCERVSTFYTDSSPYSFTLKNKDCVEELEVPVKEILSSINSFCSNSEIKIEIPANIKNTLIVRTL
jgi:hypothetical protein